MAYKQGIYKLINPSKYKGKKNNIIYRSGWEKRVMEFLDLSKSVKTWSSEEIAIRYYNPTDDSVHTYFPDLYYESMGGKKYLVEIKPYKETVPPKKPKRMTKKFRLDALLFIRNLSKWKAAKKICDKKGWVFLIWTEKELKKMGIIT